MSNLILPGSASERKIARLDMQNEMLKTQVAHLKAHLATVIHQTGGTARVPVTALAASYQIEAKAEADESAIVWTVTKDEPDELAKPS